MKLLLTSAYVVGFLLTAGGLFCAYRRATRSYKEAASERTTREALQKSMNEDLAGVMSDYSEDGFKKLTLNNERRHQAAGLRIKTIGEADVDFAMTTPVTDTAMALVEAKNNLLFAGLGLLISTLASILSLF